LSYNTKFKATSELRAKNYAEITIIARKSKEGVKLKKAPEQLI
ncbi:13544_t:CDS:2, partial [Gigaspora rosea]